LDEYPRNLVVEEVRHALDRLRESIRRSDDPDRALESGLAALEPELGGSLRNRLRPALRPVVNASGIILHTNLGRAPLNEETAQVMKSLSQGYSNLEYDLDRGKRGHRDRHLEEQFRRLLPCEAATAVNNNAAALFLVLSTLARGKKVLVSRGELVEIGGSFRVPSILEQSGASLKEVGTTNRTRTEDYRDALDGDTALILRVHPSNFRVVGFSRRPALSELVALSREAGIPLLKDAGSGYLFRTTHPSLRSEPTVEEILKAGVDLVCFSGDKLLGGPQAGIVLGKRSLMEAVRKNPLARVCRLDKATFAGLQQTLSLYEQGVYLERLPVYRMLGTSNASLESRARQIRRSLNPGAYRSRILDGFSLAGGGSAPEETIPTTLLALRPTAFSCNELGRRLRRGSRPVVARIEDDRVILDLRTVLPEEDEVLVQSLSQAASED
jgi:L-seryl-tRNA(Ser) seleniumtransferase